MKYVSRYSILVRHLGLERKLADIKAKPGDFQAFTPYSLEGSTAIHNHVSYHPDGERHVVSQYRVASEMRTVKEIEDQSVTFFDPPARMKGAVQIYLGGDPLGQFRTLDPPIVYGTAVILDAESAGFVEAPFVMRIFVVDPGNKEALPPPSGPGPRILHFIEDIKPWIAIELHQPTIAV